QTGSLRCVLGGEAYAAPLGDDILIGASFDPRADAAPSPSADLDNLHKLAAMIDGDATQWVAHACTAGFGERFAAIDRLPLIGQLPDEAAACRAAAELLRNDRLPLPRAGGLYAAFAFGSRGLLWATLAGVLLPAMIEGAPLPLERELLRAIDPARFVKRMLRARESD
ncbi:MAG: bifunctional tRNA (5-methylaminomethyl-2-thiouridine)(34)-methyltransferase MnmD/FAD-dependent 5-carboxymethylaminomethyl-2-thiouridine(34) oxidoreductase MnmC, partial [Burkholderiales bacterium]|nr:bifunctional tRNA (5-methylaminomethyl-2-thiouridine)(34)-methyltransferase MnmD/FAD-dependent 5-carboxymethylaminomethyl-2-thiouridine(34) oxidoreductase MnmC [Burkholderiales bacterium]